MGAELCRAGTLQSWEATEPGPHKCWQLQLHELQGSSWWNFCCPSHTALCCTSCCLAPGTTMVGHHPTFHPPPNSYPPPSAFAPPSALQLLFPCTVVALPSACKKSFPRLTTATGELFVTAQSKLYLGLLRLQNVRDMLRVSCARCFSTAWRDQDTVQCADPSLAEC